MQFLVYTAEAAASGRTSAGGGRRAIGSRDAANAVANLDVADGLEATLFAAEPQISNLDEHRHRPPRPRLGLRGR